MSVQLLELAVVAAGRRLAFAHHPAEQATIFRRVGGPSGPWQRVAVHIHSPYLDEDVLAPETFVEYYVHLQADANADGFQNRNCLVSIVT